MSIMILYSGIFFDKNTSNIIKKYEIKRLAKSNEFLHCTFKFKPSENEINEFNKILGKNVELALLGYGSNDKNSGFNVKIPGEFEQFYINYDLDSKLTTPHITSSISNDGNPIDTKDLEFVKFTEPIKVTGKFGYFVKYNGKCFVVNDIFKFFELYK